MNNRQTAMNSRTSVIMPVRNGVRFISEALDSVLQQLAPDDEVIVVDDASTDATRAVLAHMQDRRVRVLDGSGCGVSSARNIGLAAAAGEFIAFLDHDDLWPEERHRTMMRAMMDDLQLDVVFGRIRIRLDAGGTWWPWMPLQHGHHAPGSNLGNALYRSNVLHRLDGFDESLRFGEDIDYFNRLQETGIRFALCDVDGLVYRRHAGNVTNDLSAMKNFIFDLIRRHKDRIGGVDSPTQSERS
jgi:glycosyltransferase involved in cell wall biosynthesis